MNERKPLVRSAALALGLFVVAFVVLSFGGSHRSLLVVGLAVVLLVAAAVVLQLTLTRARTRGLLTRRERLIVPGLIMLAGAGLLAYWFLRTPSGGWGLSGLCALYLGTGQALAEIRSRHDGAPWRGVIVSAIGLALGALGLVLCFTVSAWWLGLTALALLGAPVGLTLLSEDVLRLRLWPLWPVALVGVLLVPAGALWLSATGFPPLFLVGLVGVLFVLVGAIASSTQADILLVVTVIALIWTTIPRGVAAEDALAPVTGQPTLVSLGDSYMSGEGAKEFFEDTNVAQRNECRRSPTAYAPKVLREGATGQRLAFFACSGALASHLHRVPQWRGEPVDETPESGVPQLEQVGELVRSDIRLAIVSIGGNDAGFADIGMACVAPGSCVERGQRWLDRLDEVANRVEVAYARVRDAVGPDVPVLVVPYPQPIRRQTCPSSLLAADEHQFVNGFVSQLDGVIRQAARDAGFYYLDAMETVLSDRGLRICDTQEAGVNFIALRSIHGFVDQAVTPTNWIHNSFHPNERGHEAMAAVLAQWLQAHPAPAPTPGAADRPAPFVPASLEDLMRPDPVSYCGSPGRQPDYCDRDVDAWTVTQLGVQVRDAALGALLVVAGWWVLWLPVLATTGPGWSRFGDRLAARWWRRLS